MCTHDRRIWRVRGAFSDSIVNEFRWETKKTSFYTFWAFTELNQVWNLIEFALMERNEGKAAFIVSCFKLIQTSSVVAVATNFLTLLRMFYFCPLIDIYCRKVFLCWIRERRDLTEIFLKTETLSVFVCAYLRKIKTNKQWEFYKCSHCVTIEIVDPIPLRT